MISDDVYLIARGERRGIGVSGGCGFDWLGFDVSLRSRFRF